MSVFTFHCPNCGQGLQISQENVGAVVTCPACGKSIQVPAFRAPTQAQPVAPQYASSQYGQPGPQPFCPQNAYAQCPPQRKNSAVVVVFAVLAPVILVGIIAALFVSGVIASHKAEFDKGENEVQRKVCIDNLRQIEGAVEQVVTGAVEQVVTGALNANKRGDYGYEYWSESSRIIAKKLFAPSSWEIVETSVFGNSAHVTVRVDSSTQGGLRISKLWKYWVKEEDDGWKIQLLSEVD